MPDQIPPTGTLDALTAVLDSTHVAPEVFGLRHDYRVMLLAVDGIEPGPSDEASEALLSAAEAWATQALANQPANEVPHVAAWREAYRSFGAKPQRTRNSLEALMRRAANGLPRVNRLTDVYNAISLLHQVPLGGEDLGHYRGAPRLVRATGEESFDTTANGETVIEHPEPGEVVWCDDAGVTCRRWNWRQCSRTSLTDETTTAVFILDALDPMNDDELAAATDALADALSGLGVEVRHSRRCIGAA
jgi:DNA/RNA-binding domain of Phe-tRNA-synthetase-like protein